jgi:hypothetical protein
MKRRRSLLKITLSSLILGLLIRCTLNNDEGLQKPPSKAGSENSPPVLSQAKDNNKDIPFLAPVAGSPSTLFSYTVHYYDADGDIPEDALLIIDGDKVDDKRIESMSAQGEPANGIYTFTTNLDPGDHNFNFYFNNNLGESCRLPAEDGIFKNGPQVKPK